MRTPVLCIGLACLTAAIPAAAQEPSDTTITLGDRPALVWIHRRWVPEDSVQAQMRAVFRRVLSQARPRLIELGFDVHEAVSLSDSVVTVDTTFHFYSRTVRLRWRDSTWLLPTAFGDGHYLWSPGARAYVCDGSTSPGFIVNDAHWYREMLRRGVERELLRRCRRAL